MCPDGYSSFNRISIIIRPPSEMFTLLMPIMGCVYLHVLSKKYSRVTYRFTSGRRIITSRWRRVQTSAAEHIRHIQGCRTAVGRQIRGGYESLSVFRRRMTIPVQLHVQSCSVPVVTISGERLSNHVIRYIIIILLLLKRCCRSEDLLGGWPLVGKCSRCHHNLFSITSCGPFRFCRGWSDCDRKGPSDPPPPPAEGDV